MAYPSKGLTNSRNVFYVYVVTRILKATKTRMNFSNFRLLFFNELMNNLWKQYYYSHLIGVNARHTCFCFFIMEEKWVYGILGFSSHYQGNNMMRIRFHNTYLHQGCTFIFFDIPQILWAGQSYVFRKPLVLCRKTVTRTIEFIHTCFLK